MEHTTEVSTAPKGNIKMLEGDSPAEMIRMAVSGGADLEKMERLLDLQMKWEQNENKKAYVKAMVKFKENPPVITKDKKNSQYDSMYTTLGNLVNTINPALSKQGLSASWRIEQNGIVKVTCTITHKLTYSESTSASAPVDTSGSKNAIQQIKSTVTYLKAVTLESITGLASSDTNLDDDGKSSEPVVVIDEKQLGTLIDLIASHNVNEPKFLKYLKIKTIEEMPQSMYSTAITAIKSKEKPNDNA